MKSEGFVASLQALEVGSTERLAALSLESRPRVLAEFRSSCPMMMPHLMIRVLLLMRMLRRCMRRMPIPMPLLALPLRLDCREELVRC